MTDFEKTYQNYNPRAAALAEARALLTEAAKAAMADGTLPEAELPAFIVEIPADTKNGDIASNLAMAGARTWRKYAHDIYFCGNQSGFQPELRNPVHSGIYFRRNKSEYI